MLRLLGGPGELAFALLMLAMAVFWAARGLALIHDLWMFGREQRKTAARPSLRTDGNDTRRDRPRD